MLSGLECNPKTCVFTDYLYLGDKKNTFALEIEARAICFKQHPHAKWTI